MRRIQGLSEIADRFKAVVTDQYGVLHDGGQIFAGALSALQNLAARGIPVVMLTNSGKRAATNAKRLTRMGLTPDLVGQTVSSGELARQRLETLGTGTTVALLTRDNETELIDGLNLQLVDPRTGAIPDLIVLAGIRPEATSREAYRALLAPSASARVPMLLVNPDTLMAQGGQVYFGAGAVAEDYAKGGARVTSLGKPAKAMFDAALQSLGHPAPHEVLMIGDSPDHDIGGARQAGLATLLVQSGVQADLEGPEADFVISHLRWSAKS